MTMQNEAALDLGQVLANYSTSNDRKAKKTIQSALSGDDGEAHGGDG
jgi:hypothetical protein